mmetsp:Transcript_47282/g.147820  ORF Transcript_47282/g.147820 Transcript_47282/m.147820 type:complete len:212 (-) Transcript_47282:1396-2031(-)
MGAFQQQASECKGLSSSPVDPLLLIANSLSLVAHHLLQLAMNVEALGHSRYLLPNGLQGVLRDSSLVILSQLKLGFVALPLSTEPSRRRGAIVRVLGLLEGFVEDCVSSCLHLFNLLPSDTSFSNQLVGVDLENVRMLLNDFIHQRLSKHGLIDLVMAMPPVTDDVHHHILAECLSKFRSQGHDPANSLWVITIDMENGRTHRLSDICAVR